MLIEILNLLEKGKYDYKVGFTLPERIIQRRGVTNS